MQAKYWALIVLIGTIFGSSFLLVAITAREVTPLMMASGRAILAALIAWSVVWAMKVPVARDPKLIVQLLALGVLNYGVSFVLQPIAQKTISTGLMSMITLLLPIMTLVVAHFWPGGEKASRIKLIGASVGFVGAMILIAPSLADGLGGQMQGVILAALSIFAFAVSFSVARAFAKVPPQVVAAWAMTGAVLVTVPPALIFEELPQITQATTWFAWVGLAVFPTALTFQLMYWLLPIVGATNYSVNAYIGPVVAMLLGAWVLNEVIHPVALLGMAVIVVGLLIIDGRLLRLLPRKSLPAAE